MRALVISAAAGLVFVTGCSGSAESSAPTPVAPTGPAASAPASPGAAPSSAAPARTPTRPRTPAPTTSPSAPPAAKKPKPKPDPISMEALIQKRYDGRSLKLGRQLAETSAYTRYLITYRGDGLKISGVMNVPKGKGPFPVLVLNHGYIDRSTYFPGQGMPREHDYLARQGYVVLHTDYRGHATSDNDKNIDYELRMPYTIDTINAVLAVKNSKLTFLDRDRVGWLGRSMGGEVTLRALAAQPGLVDAAVVYASTSSLTADNWEQFYRPSADRRAVNARIKKGYGLPDDSPEFWRAASARPYFDRVTEPLLVHHGRRDDTCPISWSRATVKALEKKDKEVTFYTYAGEGHTFEADWSLSIRRTVRFFDRHLD